METPGQTAVREAITFNAGLNRLLKMCGLKSIDRNMATEDKGFSKNFTGKPDTQSAGIPTDDMHIMSAGNVTFHVEQPEQKPSGSQSAPVAPEQKAGAGWLPKLALALAMLGGGAGAGYIIHDLLKPQPAATDTDTDTITEMYYPGK